ncbi:hypothetical protein GCM10027406_01520 [Leifsonia lichenia]
MDAADALLLVELVEIAADGDVGDLERFAEVADAHEAVLPDQFEHPFAAEGGGERFGHAAIVRLLRLLVNTKANG